MARRIYLIRHGSTRAVHRCIGVTDVPLTKQGIADTERLKRWIDDLGNIAFYSSPLVRCRQTADILAGGKAVDIRTNLREMDNGEWENKTFEQIRRDLPKEYEERGRNIGYYTPPGGESFYAAGRRFGEELDKIRKESERNLLVVAHAGVIRSYICSLLGYSMNEVMSISQPDGAINILEDDGRMRINKIGYRPYRVLDQQACKNLWDKHKTKEKIRDHMRAVADYAMELYLKLEKAGVKIDGSLLYYSAYLHDIVRMAPDHAVYGAKIVKNEGYEEVADVIASHHRISIQDAMALNEKALLFYADKRVKGNCRVSLRERFEASMYKCADSQAFESHELQYRLAKSVEDNIKHLCGSV